MRGIFSTFIATFVTLNLTLLLVKNASKQTRNKTRLVINSVSIQTSTMLYIMLSNNYIIYALDLILKKKSKYSKQVFCAKKICHHKN